MATWRGGRKRSTRRLRPQVTDCDKGLGGIGGESDGGTGSRLRATLLTWMAEKTTPVFVVATANDIQGLPPEMTRRGRFDAVFHVDLPNRVEREAIWRIHLNRVKQGHLVGKDFSLLAGKSEGFSGAEIEQAVHDAMYDKFRPGEPLALDVKDLLMAVQATTPLAAARATELGRLRAWAKANASPASTSDIETGTEEVPDLAAPLAL